MQSNEYFNRVSTGNGFNPYELEEDLIDDLGCDDDHDDLDFDDIDLAL